MIALDAGVLSLVLFPSASIPKDFKTGLPIDRARERLDWLIADLQERGERVLIPTPALSEVLSIAPDVAAYIHIIQERGCFKLSGFGERAAVEVALRVQQAIKNGDKKEGLKTGWQKIKYDRQIIAIAKVEGCSALYSTDEDVHKHGTLWRIPIFNIADIAPGGQIELFSSDEGDEHRAEAGEFTSPETE